MEGDLQRSVGANIRRLRTARQLSQEQMADLIGVHRTYLGGLERGERNITLRGLERIAHWLDVEAVELLSAAEPPSASH